ncbi:MAG: LVIVD repeat-containing protein [Actinomycetota bacterium]
MKIFRRSVAATAVAGLLLTGGLLAPAPAAPLKGEGKNLKIIANIDYRGGTDMEFVTIKGRDYAIAANGVAPADEKRAGLHVIDITNPEKPKEVGFAGCRMNQGDIQISHDKKYAYMAADSAPGPEGCLSVGKRGFQVFDIRNPKKPKPVGVADTGNVGSHNMTAHPTKPYVYNSSSSLAGVGSIQIWNVKNPKKPEMVKTFPSLPHAPHDISFNSDGTKIVTAAISHIDIFDTTDVESPSLMISTQCPGCSITHDAKFTPDDSGLIVGDEGGGGGTYPCPGGALYFYQLQGGFVPVLTGIYEPDRVVFPREGQQAAGACTSHVFDISDDGKEVAISWYSAGTRHLNVEAMTGLAFGENAAGGVEELGWFQPDGGSSWSSKFYKGTKYIYSNDIQRGFDVFKVVTD